MPYALGSFVCARALFAAALLAAAGTTQEWGRFRGPSGQGHNDAHRLPEVWLEDHVEWRVSVGGAGHSSPVVWGDRVYLTRCPEDGVRHLVAFGAEAGDEVWLWEGACEMTKGHSLNSMATSTPTVDESGVYVVWTSGQQAEACAWDLDGELRWRQPIGAFAAQHGSGASPVIAGGVVLVTHDVEGEGPSVFVALDKESGEQVWRLERPSSEARATYSSPTPFRIEGGPELVLFATTGSGLFAANPADGAVVWELDLEFEQRVVGAPCLVGDLALICAGAGNSGRESAVVRLGAVSAEIVHRPRRSIPYVPGSVAVDGAFYQFNDGGVASCIDAETGEVHWRERLEGSFFGSAVTDGHTVYIVDRQGMLFCLAASPEFHLHGALNLGAPTQTTPALAGGHMFVRTRDHLICLTAPK